MQRDVTRQSRRGRLCWWGAAALVACAFTAACASRAPHEHAPGPSCDSAPLAANSASAAPSASASAGAPLSERRRLRAMLDERLAKEKAGDAAGVKAVDDAIRERFEQPLAIMITDMSGLTKRTREEGIISTLAQVRRLVLLAEPLLPRFGAEWIKVDADDLMIKCKSPAKLLELARALAAAVAEHNQRDPSHAIGLSIGLGYGPVLVVEHDVWGNAINTGSKLGEDVGEAGEILAAEEFIQALPADVAASCKKEPAPEKRGSKLPFWSCQ
ncbi:MAG: hypothetical protein U0271_01860 [Polyangiaceae bacterium]